jgi:hypothetical protein
MPDNPKASPPPDWALEMAKLRYDPMQDRAAYNIATSGPTNAIPRDPAKTSASVRGGQQAAIPIQPPPGVELIDKICIAADQRERAQAAQGTDFTQLMTVMTKQMEMQSQMLTALAAVVLRMEGKK